jgi:hypothetical protein
VDGRPARGGLLARGRAQNRQELKSAPEYSLPSGEARSAFIAAPPGGPIVLRQLPRGVEMNASNACGALTRCRTATRLFVQHLACLVLDNRATHFAERQQPMLLV